MSIAHSKLISKSYDSVLSLAEAKDQLRLLESETDQDSLITACMVAAIATAESHTEHIYSDTIYQFRIEPSDITLELPYPDFVEITKVEAVIPDSSNQVLYNKTGPVGTLSDYIVVDDWVNPAELTISTDNVPETATYLILTCAFGGQTPKDVLNGIKMMLAHYFDNPRAVVTGTIAIEVPQGPATIFHINRFYRFG